MPPVSWRDFKHYSLAMWFSLGAFIPMILPLQLIILGTLELIVSESHSYTGYGWGFAFVYAALLAAPFVIIQYVIFDGVLKRRKDAMKLGMFFTPINYALGVFLSIGVQLTLQKVASNFTRFLPRGLSLLVYYLFFLIISMIIYKRELQYASSNSSSSYSVKSVKSPIIFVTLLLLIPIITITAIDYASVHIHQHNQKVAQEKEKSKPQQMYDANGKYPYNGPWDQALLTEEDKARNDNLHTITTGFDKFYEQNHRYPKNIAEAQAVVAQFNTVVDPSTKKPYVVVAQSPKQGELQYVGGALCERNYSVVGYPNYTQPDGPYVYELAVLFSEGSYRCIDNYALDYQPKL